MSEERGALSRWSQRKAAARRGETSAEQPEQPRQPEHEVPQAAPPVDHGAAVAQSDTATDDTPVLPPIEDLTAQSDYTAFLGDKVPEHLRRAALRKLWTSDPVFANLDGLNHYDEDYNLVDTTIGVAQTAYRAGLGYLEEIEDKRAQIESVLGSPCVKKIESAEIGVAEGESTSSTGSDAVGHKSADAVQQDSMIPRPAADRDGERN